MSVEDYYQFCKTANVPFDQLIIEHDSGGNFWVHISLSGSGTQRGICMIGRKLDEGGTATVSDGLGTFLEGRA